MKLYEFQVSLFRIPTLAYDVLEEEMLRLENLKFTGMITSRAVEVHVFDWGRSELNTLQNHQRLSAQEKAQFWKPLIESGG